MMLTQLLITNFWCYLIYCSNTWLIFCYNIFMQGERERMAARVVLFLSQPYDERCCFSISLPQWSSKASIQVSCVLILKEWH
ncbi:hypothetical protein POPTR_004G202300v4 [Populus trichocarpa]|uniref:Uncharacterized protein n=1 Tax=Populus trichocarpa TaxID=3694 RepID=A0ACC0T5N9_POPTR|nr:hypothetical protein POPTR_004G202300v4 [Populus trichocarpa]